MPMPMAALCLDWKMFVLCIIFLLLHDSSASTQLCSPQRDSLGNTVSCSKKGLTRLPDTLPAWTDILDVSSNGITQLTPEPFIGLHRLTELNLNNNEITEISPEPLQHLPNLTTLKCGYNHLTSLPGVPFNSNITHLYLHHNEISVLNSSLLESMLMLHLLDLNFNRISVLQSGASFPFLPNLHQLYLSNNRLTSIEAGSLDNLTALEMLKLKKNRIEILPKDLFARTNNMKYLELSRNRIRSLEGLGFSGLKNLLSLKLRRNFISQLQDGAFYGLNKIQNLQLDFNNISTISKGWLYGLTSLQQLSLSHNRVMQVGQGGWESCDRLFKLDLMHNAIVSIAMATFKGLESLQYLFLNHNKISSIADGALKELPSLQVLELSDNDISWAIEDSTGIFDGLVSLTRLSLDNNDIKSLSKQTFMGLSQLRQLRLMENPITSIQSNVFNPIDDLGELRLNSSFLLCDCQLSWLAEWLRETGFGQSVKAECSHPELLRGRNVIDVEASEFKCSAYPKQPVLLLDPVSQIALMGSNASLVCEAISSDQSEIVVQWKKDGELLPDWRWDDHRDMLDAADDSEAGFQTWQVHSVLHLTQPVQDDDTGLYQCVVSNSLGSAYSRKASVTVHVFPVFSKRPSDVTVRVGNSARLECAASGQPSPEIAWQKDGGDDFPAARERRMHVMPKDHVFFIMELKAEDQGVYSCTASNAAGTAVANASVNVLQTPSFVTPMVREKVSVFGDTTVLECMASGSPKPHLTWFKDRQQLLLTERHFLTVGNQLLIIVQTSAADVGLYTCVMTNTLGTEKGLTELLVVSADKKELLGPNQTSAEGGSKDYSTTTGIIIIAVVCCVVGTSLIWVIIIYHTRGKRQRPRAEQYSTSTDDTTLPAGHAANATAVYSTDKDIQQENYFAKCSGTEYNRCYGDMAAASSFSNLHLHRSCMQRAAAIFPSDVTDNHHQQIAMDEQREGSSADNSLSLLLHSAMAPHCSDSSNSAAASDSCSSLQSADHHFHLNPQCNNSNLIGTSPPPPPYPPELSLQAKEPLLAASACQSHDVGCQCCIDVPCDRHSDENEAPTAANQHAASIPLLSSPRQLTSPTL